MTDPITNNVVYTNGEGYDATQNDDVHLCGDATPTVSNISVTSLGSNNYRITVNASNGRYKIRDVVVQIDGQAVATLPPGGSFTTVQSFTDSATKRITAVVTDEAYYTHSHSRNYTPGE